MGNSKPSRERDLQVREPLGRLSKTDRDSLKQQFDRIQDGGVSHSSTI